MTETSTTYTPSPELISTAVAHGLMALGMHMAECALPLYLGIDTPDAYNNRGRRIEIHLTDKTFDAWVASIEVDDTGIEARREDSDYPTQYVVLGRLPNSGVRIRLYKLLPRPILGAVQS